MEIIHDENLNEEETRKFMEDCFRNGEVKTTGTAINNLMPPNSRFGGGKRDAKKRGVIDKIKSFFERFFGIGDSDFTKTREPVSYLDSEVEPTEAAEAEIEFGK